jgi:tRNA1Val (adenine37-N6)-methyltransferase
MKVGTDGVLLGAWTNTMGIKKILDIGTGTGLIALMLAQRSAAIIDALEIDALAAGQALENVNNSPWNNRIHVICDSFQDYSKSKNQYDLIVSNPPYFKNSLRTPDNLRAMARHDDDLTMDEIICGLKNILVPEGRFCMIWPYSELQIVRTSFNKAGLFESRITYVSPLPGKPIKRAMIEFSFFEKKTEESMLVIEEFGRHQYSEDFKELTKAYYLSL